MKKQVRPTGSSFGNWLLFGRQIRIRAVPYRRIKHVLPVHFSVVMYMYDLKYTYLIYALDDRNGGGQLFSARILTDPPRLCRIIQYWSLVLTPQGMTIIVMVGEGCLSYIPTLHGTFDPPKEGGSKVL